MSLGRVKKGDMVMVLAGKDRGKTGKVLKAIPEKGKIVIEKINTKIKSDIEEKIKILSTVTSKEEKKKSEKPISKK